MGTKRIWNGTWPNTKRELSKKATINRKKSSFATSVEKSMETTNLGSITSRVTVLSTNAKLVLVASRRLVVSNTTWHSILVLLHSIVESAGKLLLLGTNLFFIKNHGIQTSDRTRANGAAKVSYSHTNWPNIGAESTRAKNPSCNMCDQRFTDSSSLSHHRKRHAGVIHQTPRVITQQTITSANGEQAVIVTTGGDE